MFIDIVFINNNDLRNFRDSFLSIGNDLVDRGHKVRIFKIYEVDNINWEDNLFEVCFYGTNSLSNEEDEHDLLLEYKNIIDNTYVPDIVITANNLNANFICKSCTMHLENNQPLIVSFMLEDFDDKESKYLKYSDVYVVNSVDIEKKIFKYVHGEKDIYKIKDSTTIDQLEPILLKYDENTNQVLKNIEELILDDRLDKALDYISDYNSDRFNNNVEFINFKAIIAIKMDEYEIAINNLEYAITLLKEANLDVQYNLAYAYDKNNDIDKAIEVYKIILDCVHENEKLEVLELMKDLYQRKELMLAKKYLKEVYNDIKEYKFDDKKQASKFTSIIILTCNQLHYTRLCIESIRKFTKEKTYEIIIVDNNSSDGTIKWLEEQSDLKVIYNKENLGSSTSYNQGIRLAIGENILFLNNNILVTPNWLYNLDNALWSSENIGAVGAVSNKGTYYQEIEVNYNSIIEMFDFSKYFNKSNSYSWKYRTRLADLCILVKRSIINRTGLLDEIFVSRKFMCDDILYRMVNENYKILLCMDTFIHSLESDYFKENDCEYDDIISIDYEKFLNKWNFDSDKNSDIRFGLINCIEEDKKEILNILEIGCGTGATLLEINNRYKNSNVYGIEICEEAANIGKKDIDILTGDIEKIELPYDKRYFDYIILGDKLASFRDHWSVLDKLKSYIKIGGRILASIPNVMNVNVLRNLINGSFSYEKEGILDIDHIKFFTLEEIKKLFCDTNYTIEKIDALSKPLSKDDESFIDDLCSISGEELRELYKDYNYIVKVKYDLDISIYENEDLIELKYKLMRMDNEIDIENSLDYVFDMEGKYKDEFIGYLSYIAKNILINKCQVLNRIGVEAFNRNLYDFSVSVFLLAFEFNRNDIDTVYNISYIFSALGESERALDIVVNSDSDVRTNEDIISLIEMLKSK